MNRVIDKAFGLKGRKMHWTKRREIVLTLLKNMGQVKEIDWFKSEHRARTTEHSLIRYEACLLVDDAVIMSGEGRSRIAALEDLLVEIYVIMRYRVKGISEEKNLLST